MAPSHEPSHAENREAPGMTSDTTRGHDRGWRESYRQYTPARPLLLILGASLALNVVGVWWGVFEGSLYGWAVDAITPNDVIRSVAEGFENGWLLIYPPLHGYLLAIAEGPLLALHKLGRIDVNAYPAYGLMLLIGNLVTVFMALATLWVLYACAMELGYGKRAGTLAVAIAALTPTFVYYSKTTNVDVPYTFWLVLSLLFFIRTLKTHRLSAYLLFAGAATCAACTKDQALGFYLFTIPALAWAHFRFLRSKGESASASARQVARRFLAAGALAAGLVLLIYQVPLGTSLVSRHIQELGARGAPWGALEAWVAGGRSTFLETQIGLLSRSFRAIRFILGWPLLTACVLGLVAALRRRASPAELWLLVPLFSYYATFIAVVGFSFDRFFLPVAVVLSLYGGRFLSRFTLRGPPLYGIRIAIAAVVLVYSGLRAASVDALMLADSKYEARRWMEANLPPSAKLAAIGLPHYLPDTSGYQSTRLWSPSVERIREIAPDHIVVSSGSGFASENIESREFLLREFGFAIESPSARRDTRQFFRSLLSGELGFSERFVHRGTPWLNILRPNGAVTALDRINPEVRIYSRERSDPPADAEP